MQLFGNKFKELSVIALENNYTENSIDIYWEEIADKICSSFSFTDNERLKFLKNKVAKLIGCLPKIAETQTPERDGCSNLAVYIMSIRTTKRFYIHQQCDDADVFSRLHDIMNFNEGNKDIIRKGMSLLALMMINDYKRDEVEDRDNQKYNPFNLNSWNFDKLRNRLLEDYEKTESDSIDSIFNLSESATLLWQPN
jgi:hypothetical protein